MDREGLLAPVFARLHPIRDGADPVIQKRPIDEARPDVEHFDQVLAQALEAPGLIGVDHLRLIVAHEALIEIHHPAHEARREDPHAAVVQQVDALALAKDRVIAQMRIPVDHAELAEGLPPRPEHGLRDAVAHLLIGGLEGEELAPLQPVQGQQAAGGELRPGAGYAHLVEIREHMGVERGVLGLALVVQLLAHPCADLHRHLAGVDGRIHAPVQGEEHVELGEVRLHGGGHVGILQLAGEGAPLMAHRPMHLPERGGGGGMQIEGLEARLPLRPKLGHHAALDEGRAHGGRVGLQLLEGFGIFGRQGVGDGGEQLRHLHHGPLEAAQSLGQHRRIVRAGAAKERGGRHARGDPARIGAHPRIAGGAGGKAIGFVVGHRGEPGLRDRLQVSAFSRFTSPDRVQTGAVFTL